MSHIPNPGSSSGAHPASASTRQPINQRLFANGELAGHTAPAGFETAFDRERSNLRSLFDAFVLPLHWSLVRGGLRLRVNDSTSSLSTPYIPMHELTELLPANWTSRIVAKSEEGTEQTTNVLQLRYWDPADSTIHFELKVIELMKNSVVAVILFRAMNSYGADGSLQPGNRRDLDSHSPGRNSAAGNYIISEYFTAFSLNAYGAGQGGPLENKAWFEIYKNLQSLETNVMEHLMEPVGLNVTGILRQPGPYESKVSQDHQTQSQQSQQQNSQIPIYIPMPQATPSPMPYPMGGIGGPLYVPPSIPGNGGLGRSDLDPIGGFGAGMVADPRGYRQPVVPFGGGGGGGLGGFPGQGQVVPPPPGSRFDPFGPPMPNPPLRPAAPGGGGGNNPGGNNFAVPNPDAEQPPAGFDDMFM